MIIGLLTTAVTAVTITSSVELFTTGFTLGMTLMTPIILEKQKQKSKT